MKKRKISFSTVLLVVIFSVGLSLLLYPTLSDYWNSLHQSQAISSYAQEVANIGNDAYDAIWQRANDYNAALAQNPARWKPTEQDNALYGQQLDVSATGVIGYLSIAKIDVQLPLYRGTSEAVLQTGLGHIQGSSLPVGGLGTHAVLSGHRGLPSAKLLTNLDKLVEGDTFVLTVLDQVLTYQVDQILIVEPNDFSALDIQPDQDLCTLVTCTPYGINSHRLLVRGHRIDTPDAPQAVRITADAVMLDPMAVAPLVAAPMLAVLLAALLVTTRKKRP